MRRAIAGWAFASCALTTLAFVPIAAQAPAPPSDVASLLTKVGAFTDTDLAALQSGRVITRTGASPENLEASVVTAVRIATTKERALDYFNLLVSYVDGQVTVGYGKLANPPGESDLTRLTLDASDIADLRACRPGACDMKVGAATVAEVAQAVDWRAPDAAERGNAWARRALAAYAADYLKRGNAALAGYNDLGTPIDLQDHWRSMIGRSAALFALEPSLERYLDSFSGAAGPAQATDVIYWDKQRLTGLKPIIGLTHVVTWRDAAKPDRTIVVQRQIFASHYLYGSLAVTLVLQDGKDTSPSTYVVYFNRTRGDLLKGTQQPSNQTGILGRVSSLGASLQRKLGEELIKQSAERLMSAMKEALER